MSDNGYRLLSRNRHRAESSELKWSDLLLAHHGRNCRGRKGRLKDLGHVGAYQPNELTILSFLHFSSKTESSWSQSCKDFCSFWKLEKILKTFFLSISCELLRLDALTIPNRKFSLLSSGLASLRGRPTDSQRATFIMEVTGKCRLPRISLVPEVSRVRCPLFRHRTHQLCRGWQCQENVFCLSSEEGHVLFFFFSFFSTKASWKFFNEEVRVC